MLLEPKKINFVTASTFYPSICHEVIRLDGMILKVKVKVTQLCPIL